jgi:hypothetical protein
MYFRWVWVESTIRAKFNVGPIVKMLGYLLLVSMSNSRYRSERAAKMNFLDLNISFTSSSTEIENPRVFLT